MNDKKTNILIIGVGKGGSALIELFYDDITVNITGVVDTNLNAPGIKLAREFGIPVADDYKKFLQEKGLHEIINVTGSEAVQEELLRVKPEGVEVIGGHSAKLLWDLVEKRKASALELKHGNDIQAAMNSLLNLSLQEISLEELLDNALKIILSIPWLSFEQQGAIFLIENDEKKLIMKAQHRLSPPLLTMCASVPFGRCLCGQAALTGKIIFKDSLDDGHENRYEGIAPHGHYCVPIISSNRKVLGVINLYVKEGHIKSDKEEEFLTMSANTLAGITERIKAKEALQVAYGKLKETQFQLIQAEKLSAIGTLSSGVAHEVKNPLAIIVQGVNYLEKKLPRDEADVFRVLNVIKESVNRADNIIMSILDFSRESKLTLQPEDLDSILEESLQLIRQRSKFEIIEIIKEVAPDTPKVVVDRNKIEQVLVNLLLNAIQAMPGEGRLFIRGYARRLSEIKAGVGRREEDFFKPGERAVIVEVEDTGIGIPEENLKKIFDPFFTTKGPREGAGLGLTITRNIINLHKGLIEVKSEIGKGTKVTITLKAERN